MVLFRGAETHSRSVLKAVSWRTLGTLDTFAISWLFTGRVEIAGSIAGLEIITKIAWYYLHERIWAAIQLGPAHPLMLSVALAADFCASHFASRWRQASTKTSAPVTMSASSVFSLQ